jgi:Spy/CpxP family protein refolding chaperone
MRWTVLLGVGILGVAFLVGTSDGGGEPKKEKDGKMKGFLPQGWKDLNLTQAQKEKVYEIQAKYKAKLDGLKEQEKFLKQEEKSDLAKILTDDQKETLRKNVLGENPKKAIEEKKADDKK